MKSDGANVSLGAAFTKELALSKVVPNKGISTKFEPGITELLKQRFSLWVGTLVENTASFWESAKFNAGLKKYQ